MEHQNANDPRRGTGGVQTTTEARGREDHDTATRRARLATIESTIVEKLDEVDALTERKGSTLSEREGDELLACEDVIERGLATFVDVGNALATVRDGRLYRADYNTFTSYCRDRWNLGKSHAYRLIDAAKVAKIVSPVGEVANEAQARQLVKFLHDEDALLRIAERVVRPDGTMPTAETIERIASTDLEAKPRSLQDDIDDAAERGVLSPYVMSQLASFGVAHQREVLGLLNMLPSDVARTQARGRVRTLAGGYVDNPAPIGERARELVLEMDKEDAADLDRRFGSWLNKLTGVLREGAWLCNEVEDKPDLVPGTYMALGMLMYQRIAEKKLDTELREFLEREA